MDQNPPDSNLSNISNIFDSEPRPQSDLDNHLMANEPILIEQQKRLSNAIAWFYQASNLDILLTTAVTQVRQLFGAERVAILRLLTPHKGKLVVEDIQSSGELNPCHRCLESANLERDSRDIIAFSQIQATEVNAPHFDNIKPLEINQNLIIPIIKNVRIWGILSIHHCNAYPTWQPRDRELAQQIAQHLNLALQHLEQLEIVRVRTQNQEREKAVERQKIVSNLVDKIRQSLEIESIFTTATQEVRSLLKSDRAAIYRFNPDWSGEFVAESVAEGWPILRQECPIIQDTYLQENQGGRYALGQSFAVHDIYSAGHRDCHLKLLEQFAAKAYAIAPILQKDKLWGLFAVYQNSNPRHWEADEIELLAQIGIQLGIAIQQAEYHHQLQNQASQLAIAAEQERSLERQRTLAATVDKIRQSLDIDTIFSTTTQETRQLLNVERVAIYRFLPDWSGEIVAESIIPGWNSLLHQQPFVADTYLQETQGGRYRNNEYSVIDDVDRAGYSDCHVALLQDLNVRAYMIVPIFQGQNLWGLLAAYQNSTPRHWEAYEVDLLAQIGLQLGIALQQAELLKQTQHQAQTLVQTLAELRQAQTQLIQNEKMAGLGQLVAGVAHEINNPINFIYGNLSYVEEYAQDLLGLIQLYQECYPYPAAPIGDRANTIDLDFIISDLPKILDSMKIGTERIRQLVLSLRTFSRIDESQMKRVNIHDGIDSTLMILQHRLKTRPDRVNIKISREYGELPLVECYAAQLNQVFMNIFSNSIDALEDRIEQPWLRIQTEVQGEQVIVTIQDNGTGIDDKIKERIFDPFFTTKPIGKGTGLGLSIGYQIIVEKHKGLLDFTSSPGRGTEFKITIPIRQPGK